VSKVLKFSMTIVLCLVVAGSFMLFGCKTATTTTTAAAETTAADTESKDEALETADSAVAVKEWVFPWITGLSGELTAWFSQQVWAVNYATKEINDAGGVRGVPLKFEFMDEGPNPTTALPIISKAIDMKPLMAFGPVMGYNIAAAMPLFKEAKILTNATTCGQGSIQDYCGDNEVWGMTYISFDKETSSPGVMEWIKLHPEIKSVVQYVYPNVNLYVSYAKYQKEALESLGVKVTNIDVTEDNVNFASVAAEGMKYKPDGFLFTSLAVASAKITIELDKLGFKDKTHLLFFGSVDDSNFYATAKGYIDDAYLWTYYNEFSTRPAWQKLKSDCAAAFPDNPQPSLGLWSGYDAVKVLAQGIEELKLTGDEKVRTEEQAKLREWMINKKGFEYVVEGANDMTNGIKGPTTAFNQIKNNAKTFMKDIKLSDYVK